MKLFNPDAHTLSPTHRKIYAWMTLAYTAVDFVAAVLFIAGSALFFSPATAGTATWLFLIGSIFFAMRPTITVAREIAYLSVGDYADVIAG